MLTNPKQCFMFFNMPLEKLDNCSQTYSLNVSSWQRPIFWICQSEYLASDSALAHPFTRSVCQFCRWVCPISWGSLVLLLHIWAPARCLCLTHHTCWCHCKPSIGNHCSFHSSVVTCEGSGAQALIRHQKCHCHSTHDWCRCHAIHFLLSSLRVWHCWWTLLGS